MGLFALDIHPSRPRQEKCVVDPPILRMLFRSDYVRYSKSKDFTDLSGEMQQVRSDLAKVRYAKITVGVGVHLNRPTGTDHRADDSYEEERFSW